MIRIEELDVKFRDDFHFQVESFQFEDKLYRLTGENGSGKSVFLKLVSGLNRSARKAIHNNYRKRKVLYLTHQGIGLPFLTIEENIHLSAKLLGVKLSRQDYLSLFEDEVLLHQNYEKSSLGTQLKVGLSLLFAKDSYGLVILDEALNGLDDKSQQYIADQLIRMTSCPTIIVSHHDLDEAMQNKIETLSIHRFLKH